MRFLLDKSAGDVRQRSSSKLIGGQLLTPLTEYKHWGSTFAIDNGAFSGFNAPKFGRLLTRNRAEIDKCLFVSVPDVVGNGRRTLELWQYRDRWCNGWPQALVAQDGMEDLDIPWDEMQALFVGGCDPWKDSKACADIVRVAKALGKHIHVGRVNTPARYEHFAELGADTADGTGIARYDHMLKTLEDYLSKENFVQGELNTDDGVRLV